MIDTIGVVIPCYNYSRYLTEALESVIDQDYEDWKCVVVEDAGNDVEDVKKIEEEFKDRVSFVYHKENRGLSASRNTGLEALDTPYYIQLDADDLLEPYALRVLKEALDENPECDIAYGYCIDFGQGKFNIVKRLPWSIDNMRKRDITLATFLYRRRMVEKIGSYDETLPGYEDYEYQARAIAKGVKAVYVEKPIFRHRTHHDPRNLDASNRWYRNQRDYGHEKLMQMLTERVPEVFG